MRQLQFGITQKLSLVFILFALTLVSGLGAMAYANGRNALESAVRAELSSKSFEKQIAINNWVNERLSRIVALSKTPSLIDIMEVLTTAAPDSDQYTLAHDQLVRDLLPRVGSDQTLLALFIIDAQTAQVIAATKPSEEGKFKEKQPYFINGQRNPFIQNVYYSMAIGGLTITVSAPIRSSDGSLLGVLAAQLNLNEMNAIVQQRNGLRQSDDTFLVNTSNQLVTLPRLSPDPDLLLSGIRSEDVNRCLTHASGVISAPDYRGIPAITVYTWLPERELCLIVKIDEAEALQPVRSFGRTLLLVGGLVMLIASVLSLQLARAFTRPVLALQKTIERFGQGELTARVSETTNDELGLLGREFNHMAESLADRNTELEKANKELASFSYSVSHDLRAPLRSIDGFSRILQEDFASELPAEASRYLGLVRKSTQQMGELVDDLLAFSRLGRQEVVKRSFPPADLVRQVISDLNVGPSERRVEFVVGDLPECHGDPSLIKQVFFNLLTNALKFTGARTTARVEVGGEVGNGENVYFVRDNGVGFDMQYVGKLFVVFQRLHRSEDYEGTGVGLAIVQRIIHRHGGSVWAQGQVDKGATFFFSLPIVKPEASSLSTQSDRELEERTRDLI